MLMVNQVNMMLKDKILMTGGRNKSHTLTFVFPWESASAFCTTFKKFICLRIFSYKTNIDTECQQFKAITYQNHMAIEASPAFWPEWRMRFSKGFQNNSKVFRTILTLQACECFERKSEPRSKKRFVDFVKDLCQGLIVFPISVNET